MHAHAHGEGRLSSGLVESHCFLVGVFGQDIPGVAAPLVDAADHWSARGAGRRRHFRDDRIHHYIARTRQLTRRLRRILEASFRWLSTLGHAELGRHGSKEVAAGGVTVKAFELLGH